MEWRELFVLFFILVLSFSFRFVGAGQPVLNGDEGDLVDSVLDFTERGVSPWQRWAGLLPPMATWTAGIFMLIFGFEEWAVRLYGAVFGMLTVGVLFFLARLHFGLKTAVISTAFAAVMPLLVLSNRDAHPDNVLMFFALLAILVWEYAIRRQSVFIVFLGGLSAGFAVGSKYNSVVLFGFYWLFQLLSGFRASFKRLLISVFGAFCILLLLLGFSVQNAVYFVHGILYWMFNQNLTVTVPWYYSFSVLFDGLSPFLFVLLPVAVLSIKKNRQVYLHIVLCVAFIALVTLQGRKFPRHFLMAMPFASILCGRLFASVKPKLACVLLAALVISGVAGWSLYKIAQYDSHTVWRAAGTVILANTDPNAGVFVDGIEYWPARYYTKYQRRVISRLEEQLLRVGDVVFIHRMAQETPFIIGSPLQNDLTLYSSLYSGQYTWNNAFYSYALSHGLLLKVLPYDDFGNEVLIVKIIHKNTEMREQLPRQLDLFTSRICRVWFSKSAVADVMKFFLPLNIQNQVYQKCTKGCVVTCDVM